MGDVQREMTLQEWVDRLPECHSARKEFVTLKLAVEKVQSHNIAMVPCRSHMYPGPCLIDNLMMCREQPCRIERPTQHQ